MTLPDDTPSEGAARLAATTTGAKPPGPAAAKPPTPAWTEWVTATASALCVWVMRPRVRLTVVGVLLLLVGVVATNTVWTLPLVIIGALMVAVAWIGHRLDGRFAVEWGEDGTQLAFRATIKAAQPTIETPALGAAAPARAARAGGIELARAPDDVIEGEAHTVEINVTELKALIAAAEAAEAGDAPASAGDAPAAAGDAPAAAGDAPAASVRDIRIRRLTDEPDRTPRPAG